jgi:glutamyl-tRNA synthetase
VAEFRELGFTPHGILNYLVRFGWGHGDQEIFSLPELTEKFTIEACGKNDGKFDMKKFISVQYEHLRSQALTGDDEYIDRLMPFLKKKGLDNPDPAVIKAALPLVRSRSHTLSEAADEITPFISDDVKSDNDFKDVSTQVRETISSLITELDTNNPWEENSLRQLTKSWLEKHNLSMKELGGFMRLSLTGRAHSPELFQVMATLGRARTLKRLQIGVERL